VQATASMCLPTVTSTEFCFVYKTKLYKTKLVLFTKQNLFCLQKKKGCRQQHQCVSQRFCGENNFYIVMVAPGTKKKGKKRPNNS